MRVGTNLVSGCFQIMSNLVRNLGNGNDGLQQCILGLLKRLILHHSSLINVESVGELIQALLDSGAGRPRKVEHIDEQQQLSAVLSQTRFL